MEIQKNIPIPAKPKKGRHHIYPFRMMEVGDSFLLPDTKGLKRIYDHPVYDAARKFKIRNEGFDFSLALTQQGLRIWRI